MTDDQIKNAINECCMQVCGVTIEKSEWSQDFFENLGFDSLLHVELIMAIEAKYQISIPDEQAVAFDTPEQLANYLKAILPKEIVAS